MIKRKLLAGLGASGVLAAAIPGLAAAQSSSPPPPPTTFYGTATGATPGQVVLAMVTDGTNSTVCGDGIVLTEGSAQVYVVDVMAEGQTKGCGRAGRYVSFYFVGTNGTAGRVATTTAAWSGPGPVNFPLTPGNPLSGPRISAPALSRDGVY